MAESKPYVGKAVSVRAHAERNERMGLYGRDGYRVIYPDGIEVWLPTETFDVAFVPSAYWKER